MNPQVKEKWVNALESGEFKQVNRVLENEGCFCAMGVLWELYGREHNVDVWVYKKGELCPASEYDIAKWAGFSEDTFSALGPEINGRLIADYNDNGYDFKAIANLIKENL